MSIQRIRQYKTAVERAIRYSGSRNEQTIRSAFYNLLNDYAHQQNLELVTEVEFRPKNHALVYPDGTLMDALQQPRGYWESKDEYDDLDAEIASKFAKGYPKNNILFEDGQSAVLFQRGKEVGRVPFADEVALDTLLTKFVGYETKIQRGFIEAIERFRDEVPDLADELRQIIRTQYEENGAFKQQAQEFLDLAREAINPSVEMADVREMLIQHILTQDIFNVIFDEVLFHQENAIAKELGEVVGTFFKGVIRRNIIGRMRPYYEAINARAAQIYNHHEKQKFLKILYETFYKAYNPKGADRLGIVYTPNEIVRFMIESADTLLWRHFGKGLGDKGVQILDPATGTGTFITELIEYLPPTQLEHKYRHELHCNEVAILPYYIANLNIEYTYQQRTGNYVPFENIVFVDTLDNLGFKTTYMKQSSLFGLVDENAERIRRQNERDVTLIIGNPPYNAWQDNYNQQNANRPYKHVDDRIRATYGKQGTAQNQIGLYDMYTRFYRWASDRIGEDGIIAFVTNSSFIEALTYDGFRKVVADEFSEIRLIDLGGNVRKNPKLSGTKHNVFGIQAGVVIAFFVRRSVNSDQPCQIWYARRPEKQDARGKLRFLATRKFEQIGFQRIVPNKRHTWINQANEDFYDFLPVASKEGDAIFRLYSNGLKSQRDEWVYDFSQIELETRMRFFVDIYNATRRNPSYPRKLEIKWDRELDKYRERAIEKRFDLQNVVHAMDRPFVKMWLYFDRHFNGMTYNLPSIFPHQRQNTAIWFKVGHGWPFFVFTTEVVPNLLPQSGSQVLPLYAYNDLGNRVDNITDWALAQFRERYAAPRQDKFAKLVLSKQDIFHYVYAVLHNPAYREKYKLNLKRDFPRIPFYDDFWQWAQWGERLMNLHLNYESADPFSLQRHDKDPATIRKAYKATLKADTDKGIIRLDTLTTLEGVPASAWTYRLGNRSALEWILDRYKPRKPRDPTIREKFNTYDFRDYKADVIDLLCRVTTVSIETMAIVEAMSSSPAVAGEDDPATIPQI